MNISLWFCDDKTVSLENKKTDMKYKFFPGHTHYGGGIVIDGNERSYSSSKIWNSWKKIRYGRRKRLIYHVKNLITSKYNELILLVKSPVYDREN